MRQKERTCSKIYKNFVGWMRVAKLAYKELDQRESKEGKMHRADNIPQTYEL
jgi:hypothetical protein